MKKHQTPLGIISITFILALFCSNSLAQQATTQDQSKASASHTANATPAVAPRPQAIRLPAAALPGLSRRFANRFSLRDFSKL